MLNHQEVLSLLVGFDQFRFLTSLPRKATMRSETQTRTSQLQPLQAGESSQAAQVSRSEESPETQQSATTDGQSPQIQQPLTNGQPPQTQLPERTDQPAETGQSTQTGQPPQMAETSQNGQASQTGQPPQNEQASGNENRPTPSPSSHMRDTPVGKMRGKWITKLCECDSCSVCVLGFILPCFLLGRTSSQVLSEDTIIYPNGIPTRLAKTAGTTYYDMLNMDCLIHGMMYCICDLGWVYGSPLSPYLPAEWYVTDTFHSWIMLKRKDVRSRFQIEGSEIEDCCVSFWCQCCAIIQHDHEVRRRLPDAMAVVNQQPQMVQPMTFPVAQPEPFLMTAVGGPAAT
ncbi:PLAC8 family-domain-containing protein [Xylariomycetidae sp. FL0641]|nr:PLAC8 family-domain-containing protein [Xylariomycetidae sp. FL0641]